jgi:hypothetical protein
MRVFLPFLASFFAYATSTNNTGNFSACQYPTNDTGTHSLGPYPTKEHIIKVFNFLISGNDTAFFAEVAEDVQ